MLILLVLLQVTFFSYVTCKQKKPQPYNMTEPSSKFDNPNYIRDRLKNLIHKPEMPDSWNNRHRQKFDVAWMDWCDPYHCNDYHKLACGLNRNAMKFKWFQSQCHIILNNQCSTYRGAMKFDIVDTKFCYLYVMYLRLGCPETCDGEAGAPHNPACGLSTVHNQAVLFRSRCALDMVNCRGVEEEYEEVSMAVCDYYLRHG